MAGGTVHPYGWPWMVLTLLVLCYHPNSRQFGVQADFKDEVDVACNATTDASNGTFMINLNRVMGVLRQEYLTSLYGNSSSADVVYGMYQCRGDLSAGQCSDCMGALMVAASCPSGAVGQRVLWQGCYLRYETYDFLSDGADVTFVTGNCSSSSGSGPGPGPLYAANLAAALNLTAPMAPSRPGGQYFRLASQGSGTNAAYALAQCLGYLTPKECAACLSNAASNISAACKDFPSGYVYLVTCYYVYGNTPLLFNTATAPSPSPAALSGPPPPSAPDSIALSPASSPRPPAASSNPSVGNVLSPPAPIPQEKKTSSSKVPVGVGASVAGVLAIASAVAAAVFLRRRSRSRIKQGGSQTRDERHPSLPYRFRQGATKYTLDELRQATGGFDPRYKLGQGGFGPVYKGRLASGQEVAIKMLSSRSHQGLSEFSSEVNLITTVQHRNLIQLLGCCTEDSHRLLVYEYLPNRSLDIYLFNSDLSHKLQWKTRFDIIVGIARGVSYLHEESHIKIVHRDIKASNILLDSNYTPKLADFGMARFFEDDVSHVTTSKIAGTRGYVAPEYALGGLLTEKADVYSYGVLVLEIVSGRRIIDQSLPPWKEHLLEWAWALFERRQQGELLDRKIGKPAREDADQVIRVVHVALLCTQTFPISRPSMSQVSSMLLGQSEILAWPSKPTIPGFEAYSSSSS